MGSQGGREKGWQSYREGVGRVVGRQGGVEGACRDDKGKEGKEEVRNEEEREGGRRRMGSGREGVREG